MTKANSWSEADEAYLRKHYRERSLEQLAGELGRTAGAVKTRIKLLGLSRSGRRHFTAAEDDCIRECYLTQTASEIARKIGRTEKSIHVRARTLGLEKDRRFGEAIPAAIRKHHAKGWSDYEIAAVVGCTRKSVSAQRERMGLPANGNSEHRRERVRQKTREQLAAVGVNSLGELRAKVLRDRARQAGWPDGLRPRAVQILNALWDNGPMTRPEIAAAIGMRWKGTRASLTSNDPEGSYLAHLIKRGLVISLGRIAKGKGRGHSRQVYSLAFDVRRETPNAGNQEEAA